MAVVTCNSGAVVVSGTDYNVTVEGEVVQLVVVELVKMKVVGAVVGLTVIEIEIGVSLLAVLGLEFASVDCSDDFSCKGIRCRPFLYEL